MPRDPYVVLGVTRDATEREIRDAYHAQCEINHPDRYADARPIVKAHAEARMKEVNEAYNALKLGNVGHVHESARPGEEPSTTPHTVELVCAGCAQRLRVPADATRFKCVR